MTACLFHLKFHIHFSTHTFALYGCILIQTQGWQIVKFYKIIASNHFVYFSLILFIFRQRRREGERGREISMCGCFSHTPPTGNLVHNSGMCPAWESNWRPFGSQAHTQATEPHQPGFILYTLKTKIMPETKD